MVNLLLAKNKHSKLSKQLADSGYLSKDKFKDIARDSQSATVGIVEAILKESLKPENETLEFLAKFYNLPTVDLDGKIISKQILNLIPKELAEQHSVIIFKKNRDQVDVATTNPENNQIINFISKKTGFKVDLFLTTPKSIRKGLQRYDSTISEEFEKIIQTSTKEALEVHASVEKMAEFVPIIKMVNSIIEQALKQNASDIHIQPTSKKVMIRFRLDGLLYDIAELPKEILAPLSARIKLLANLKIDNHRSPQDSRFSYKFNERDVAIRVSVIPTLHGAKVVLRLLDMEQQRFTLRRLGLNKRDFSLLKKEIIQPHGLILVTGPTGSGKTTTLYTLLHLLNQEETNVCTIEDPIEYGIDGVNQTQINTLAGLTFANGLKSLLRQDPNVLMVGEIRDTDTAQISMNAAMTGHMVLSTLHTNDAFSAPQRLVEMGVPKYLVSSVANILIGQRLVRKICHSCRAKSRSVDKIIEEYKPFFDLETVFKRLKSLDLLDKTLETFSDISFYYGKGCPDCNFTGFRGRIGVYEIVQIDTTLRRMILDGASPEMIKQYALTQGTLTMAEDGILKVFSGRTALSEIIRVTKD